MPTPAVAADLPIHAVLDGLKDALIAQNCAVLVAAPGAGKTTITPLALLGQPWVRGGKVLVLEPRRLAARTAAEFMARSLGERAGETVGYRVRLQAKVSARTRVEVVTEGVFTRMILDDPGLDGVAAVLFDEFHERSLDADLGLALARETQGALREDLRILVMSATLDGARVSKLLGQAPVIESRGRQYPVDTRYLGRDQGLGLEEQAVKAVLKALAEEEGGVLVFLPGQGEIRRTERLLNDRLNARPVDVAPLFGALAPAEQDRAISPAALGRRKVVLASSIAETSLTIEGVRVVIDAGLSRGPRFDPASGLTRLATVRVSRAAADQRRGRAGRTGPGVCYRLWDEAETRALPAFEPPEILQTDLSGLALDLARWGARDPARLALLDQPPSAAFKEARGLLHRLQALDADGALTAHGRALAQLSLPPRLAHMVLRGAAAGLAERAALIALVITERGLGGTGVDLGRRLDVLAKDQSARATDGRRMADRWAKQARDVVVPAIQALSDGLLMAEAFPDRIAKARGSLGQFQMASGRGVQLDPTDALAREPWLAVGDLGGGEARDRVLLAAPINEEALLQAFADRVVQEDSLATDDKGRLRARRRLRLDRLVLAERAIENPEPALVVSALLTKAKADGLETLNWGEAAQGLRRRAAFLRSLTGDGPDLSDSTLSGALDLWLAPLLAGKSALSDISPGALDDAIGAQMDWAQLKVLDAMAPASWIAPTGTHVRIDYAAEAGPSGEVRVQELFGLDQHPTVAGGRVPLILVLLSPARRPIQVTRDLPGFWRGSWKAVRSDLRGRYPKHPWPEDPLAAPPTMRAKPRGS